MKKTLLLSLLIAVFGLGGFFISSTNLALADGCDESSVDEVVSGSLTAWTVNNTGGNPIFSFNEIVSPYDSGTAIQTGVVGNTISMCPSQSIEKNYDVSGNTSSTKLKAYLEFSSTMDEYNFPYVVVSLYDNNDNRVGYQVYYGKGVISGIYAGYAAANPESYTELSASAGDMILDLSRMGSDIEFSRINVTLANYACEGVNSIVFDKLRVFCGDIDGDDSQGGDIVGQLVLPTVPLTVYQNTPFTFKSSVQCVNGNCGDITATLDPENKIRMLIYNPNFPGPNGEQCKGNYGLLPYDYLAANGVEVTYWCNSNIVDASVLANYDVLYVGRARAQYYSATYINSTDLKNWVSNGGGAILESTGDSFEPGTSNIIWPGVYDLFGYNNCPIIDSGDNAGGGPLNKLIEHSIWDGVNGPVGDSSYGLYDSELGDSCIGTGIKIGSSGNSQSPMVNQFGSGRTYSGVLVDYTLNADSQRYFLNVVNWVAQGGAKGVVPMNAGEPFYTSSQNPQAKADVACLGDMQKDATCEQSWTVMPTGRQGRTYEFFTIYDSSLGKQATTTKVKITIYCDDPDGNGVCVDAEPDTTAPVISVKGNNPVSIFVGDSYTDEGATANDNIDGDISASIIASSSVDTSIAGDYMVTYNVSDLAGNNAIEVVRSVKVSVKPAPVSSGGGSGIFIKNPPAKTTYQEYNPNTGKTTFEEDVEVLGVSEEFSELSEAEIVYKSGSDKSVILAPVAKTENLEGEKKVLNKYEKLFINLDQELSSEAKQALINFIYYGTKSTLILGEGERAGVLGSYKSAFNKLPKTIVEWEDVIKIANGRWPGEISQSAEARATQKFVEIYLREVNRSNKNDDAAVVVMAYGLRPANRNMESEKQAIAIFKSIFKKNPSEAFDWDIVRAIAYSGAVR